MPFDPKFFITSKVATSLMRIEAARQAVQDLPITPSVLATLRETARMLSTHYSTMIEGNRLTQEQVSKVIEHLEFYLDEFTFRFDRRKSRNDPVPCRLLVRCAASATDPDHNP